MCVLIDHLSIDWSDDDHPSVFVHNVEFEFVRAHTHNDGHILDPHIERDGDEGAERVNEQLPRIISVLCVVDRAKTKLDT